MRRILSLSVAALLLVLPLASAQAQQLPADVDSMMHRLFASREFASQRFGPARWVESGAAYTTVERSDADSGGRDIVRYETSSGDRSVLVAATALVPAGDTAALSFDDYIWSPDNSKLLLFTNTERVWRQNSRGDYWVLDRESGDPCEMKMAGSDFIGWLPSVTLALMRIRRCAASP